MALSEVQGVRLVELVHLGAADEDAAVGDDDLAVGCRQSRLAGDIYMNLHGVGQAVDIVLVTSEQVERYRSTPWLVIAPALREGRDVYRR